MPVRTQQRVIRFVPYLLGMFIMVLYYVQPAFLEGFERNTYDLRFRAMRGPLEPDNRIAIVAIDKKSIDELGRFPWSRKHFTALVERASAAGARALIFDIMFPEEESPGVDGALAASLRLSGIATLAAAFELDPDGTPVDITDNMPLLNSAARRTAHINVTPDEDGVIRWSPLLIRYGGRLYPSIALAAAAEALGAGDIKEGAYEVLLGGMSIPTDRLGRLLINYTGPQGMYERFSFSDVVKGRVGPERLKDRILFVGATALGIYDLLVTPFSNNTPGVEINAAIADNIMRGDFIRRGGVETLIDLFFVLALCLAAFYITLRLRAASALPLSLAVIAGYVYFAYYMFLEGQWSNCGLRVFRLLHVPRRTMDKHRLPGARHSVVLFCNRIPQVLRP
jgi:adenylate cyclase